MGLVLPGGSERKGKLKRPMPMPHALYHTPVLPAAVQISHKWWFWVISEHALQGCAVAVDGGGA
jgi:hypothetical protein